MRLRLIYEANLEPGVRDFGDYKGIEPHKLIKKIESHVRWLARKETEPGNDQGFSPSDEDDVYQLGMYAAWKYIVSREKRGLPTGYHLAKDAAWSAITRNGTKDIRVTGTAPISAPGDVIDQPEQRETLTDVAQPDSPWKITNQEKKEIIEILETMPDSKAKLYTLKTLEGYGPTEIGKMFGISKVGVSRSVKNMIPKLQSLLRPYEERAAEEYDDTLYKLWKQIAKPAKPAKPAMKPDPAPVGPTINSTDRGPTKKQLLSWQPSLNKTRPQTQPQQPSASEVQRLETKKKRKEARLKKLGLL